MNRKTAKPEFLYQEQAPPQEPPRPRPGSWPPAGCLRARTTGQRRGRPPPSQAPLCQTTEQALRGGPRSTRSDPSGSDRFRKRLIVPLVLIRVALGEVSDRLVELVVRTQVLSDRDWVP